MKLTAATLASLVMSTSGWWCEGHMLVAEIAVLNMEPQLVAELNNITSYLTKQDFPQSADFTQAACWADDIKKAISQLKVGTLLTPHSTQLEFQMYLLQDLIML